MKKRGFAVDQITAVPQQSRGRRPRRRRLSPGRDFRADLLSLEEGLTAGMLPSEARELKRLRHENGKLKRLVADLSLDKTVLQDVVQESSKARPAT